MGKRKREEQKRKETKKKGTIGAVVAVGAVVLGVLKKVIFH